MIDTGRITKGSCIEGKNFKIRDLDAWDLVKRGGDLVRAKKVVKLNETIEGDYNGTVGITYNNQGNFLNVQVSSIPVMVHGSSMKEISVNELDLAEEARSFRAGSVLISLNGRLRRTESNKMDAMGVAKTMTQGLAIPAVPLNGFYVLGKPSTIFFERVLRDYLLHYAYETIAIGEQML